MHSNWLLATYTLTPVLKRMLVTSAWKLYFCKAFLKLA